MTCRLLRYPTSLGFFLPSFSSRWGATLASRRGTRMHRAADVERVDSGTEEDKAADAPCFAGRIGMHDFACVCVCGSRLSYCPLTLKESKGSVQILYKDASDHEVSTAVEWSAQ